MDECPIFFEVPLPPAPIPEPTGPLWFYNDPDLCGALTFGEDMNTTIQPKANQLEFDIDSSISQADTFTWGTNRMSQVDLSIPGLTPTDVSLLLPIQQNKYRTALGAIVPAYNLEAFHVIPTARSTFDGFFTSTIITFNLAMDTSIVPAPSSIETVINGTPHTPGVVRWLNPLELEISVITAGVPPVTVTVEIQNADPNLRSSLGSVMCPFFLDSVIS